MKRLFVYLALVTLALVTVAVGAFAQTPSSEAPSLPQVWNFPPHLPAEKHFQVAKSGTYRWDFLSAGTILEMSVFQTDPDSGRLTLVATNRNLQGGLDPWLQTKLARNTSYLFSLRAQAQTNTTLQVKFSRSEFAQLGQLLQSQLTQDSSANQPLPLRWEQSLASAASQVCATQLPDGSLVIALVASDGSHITMVSSNGTSLGKPLRAQTGVITAAQLSVTPHGFPLLVFTTTSDVETRVWNGLGWVEVATPLAPPLALTGGTPRLIGNGPSGLMILRWNAGEWSPAPAVSAPTAGPYVAAGLWNSELALLSQDPSGQDRFWLISQDRYWNDTSLPQSGHSSVGSVVATPQTLWALMTDTTARWHLYQYRQDLGWQVTPLPMDSVSWSMTGQGDTLYALAQGPNTLELYRWEGASWAAGINLKPLADPASVTPLWVAPDPQQKQGLLLLCRLGNSSTKLRAYALP